MWLEPTAFAERGPHPALVNQYRLKRNLAPTAESDSIIDPDNKGLKELCQKS